MAKAAKQSDALEAHAQATVSKYARQHAAYAYEKFADRPDGEKAHDNGRMKVLSPIRCLDGLCVKNPKAKKPYLDVAQMMAAWDYHGLLDAAKGGISHELREQVDSSPDHGKRAENLIASQQSLALLKARMPAHISVMANLIFIKSPDKSLTEIWPNRTLRGMNKEIIADLLNFLAYEFGYKTG